MEKLEAMMWVATLKMAGQGNEEAIETIESQNKVRKENGQPTIQEELKALMEKK